MYKGNINFIFDECLGEEHVNVQCSVRDSCNNNPLKLLYQSRFKCKIENRQIKAKNKHFCPRK